MAYITSVMQPYVTVKCFIALLGVFPARD